MVPTIFLVPEKMIWEEKRKGGHKGGCFFWNVALKLVHMETMLSIIGFLSVVYVGKYALVDPTKGCPRRGTLP